MTNEKKAILRRTPYRKRHSSGVDQELFFTFVLEDAYSVISEMAFWCGTQIT